MSLDLLKDRGVPLEKQTFTWREMVQTPISKLDDDAFTRIRIVLMNGIEFESVLFSHMLARQNRTIRDALALVRRTEAHQQTMINWLLPADQSPLETTVAYEQVAIEVTAAVALAEPDAYLAQTFRFGLLEDFDHLYRYSAMLDRLEGKDANTILQGYTDIHPGRPTKDEHRHPYNDLRHPYDRLAADPLSKLHALTIMASEQQTQNYYLNIGPLFSDPLARQLYAEIASIEEQHVTQYESLIDPNETLLEKWLLHEANEVYNYYGCVQAETNPRIRAIWERFLDYELGHLALVRDLFESTEKRDAGEVLPASIPKPIRYVSHRDFIRATLRDEVDLRTNRTDYVAKEKEDALSLTYRDRVNSEGSPSEIAAANYVWSPGGELGRINRRQSRVQESLLSESQRGIQI